MLAGLPPLDATEGATVSEKAVEYPPEMLHAVMHALADGGTAEDERGAALAVLDALGLEQVGFVWQTNNALAWGGTEGVGHATEFPVYRLRASA